MENLHMEYNADTTRGTAHIKVPGPNNGQMDDSLEKAVTELEERSAQKGEPR